METLLINKYKPQTFEEMYLDSYLIEFLNTLIETSNLNLLITGESESGKTLLSHILLQQYYKNESIIEINKNILIINTLKEQGIQYFKNDLKIFFQTCSTLSHKKKTIIIDNIDLINENCQMILKEYIENYPNINFILTITNYQKLIDNLQSCLLTVKITKPTIEYLDKLLNTKGGKVLIAFNNWKNIPQRADMEKRYMATKFFDGLKYLIHNKISLTLQ